MELEEAKDNLRAMRLLYRLLENDNLGMKNTTSDDLVGRAQGLLKNMLEVASEQVFETILKIIAKEAGISKAPSSSSLQLRPLLAANSSHCFIEYPTKSRFSSQKDEQSQSTSPAKKAGPRLSKCGISDQGKAIKKALLNIGEESRIMQQNEQQFDVSTLHVGEQQSKPDELSEASETSSSYMDCETENDPSVSSRVKAQEEEGDISSDLFNSIKRIESRILALQLYSRLVSSKKNGSGNKSMQRIETNSESLTGQKNEGIAAGNRHNNRKSLLEGYGSMNQQVNQQASKCENLITANVKPMYNRNESLSKVENQVIDPEKDNSIITLRRSQKDEAYKATLLASRGEKLLSQNGIGPSAQSMAMVDRFHSLNRSVGGNDTLVNQDSECIQGIRISLNSTKAGPTNKDKPTKRNQVVQSETYRRKKQPLHHKAPRIALPQMRSSEHKLPPHRDRKILENIRTQKMMASSSHHESEEEFSSSSFAPSRSTSNRSSVICSSDEYEDTGDSAEENVSNTCEESSGENSYSYSQNDASSSHGTGSPRSVRSWHKTRGPEKTNGGLRRLKNKLRLIFHHHHHLHHHHHDEDEGKTSKADQNKIMSKADKSHSTWKRMVNGKKKNKVIAKGKSEKTKGGANITKVSHGKQAGQFHGLVEGLLGHMKNSNKQKTSKFVRNKVSRVPKRGNRNKLQWWQMLKGQRGVKLNNGGRLKVGFKNHKRLKY